MPTGTREREKPMLMHSGAQAIMLMQINVDSFQLVILVSSVLGARLLDRIAAVGSRLGFRSSSRESSAETKRSSKRSASCLALVVVAAAAANGTDLRHHWHLALIASSCCCCCRCAARAPPARGGRGDLMAGRGTGVSSLSQVSRSHGVSFALGGPQHVQRLLHVLVPPVRYEHDLP